MANYIFETMTQSDAAAFTATDYLLFSSSAASATNVTVSPYSGTLGASGINLTYGNETLTFPNSLSAASQSGHIVFNDGSDLIVGSTDGDASLGAAAATAQQVIYGLDGNDTIHLGTANDYAYGGTGDDTITGANGNYHIYGDASGSPVALTATQTDVDHITTGYGSSYINGNAGADVISVGSSAALPAGTTAGNNTVFGGADNDSITVLGGGNNHVNGNKGDDTIDASAATGNNLLRGGQGVDTITAGHGHDQIMGDAGNDHLIAGTDATVGGVTFAHLTVMTGGDGADTFDFSAGAAGTGVAIGGANYYQEITDFTHGTDGIDLGFTVTGDTGVLTQGTGVSFTTVSAAETYAQQLLSSSTSHGVNDVAAIQVGNDTFLFYDSTQGGGASTIDSVIKLDGVTASTLTQSSSATGTHDFSAVA